MGQIWIRELTGGLDTRKMPVTSAGGTLVRARNGHATRGGEFEKRAAFVRTYELPPAASTGLAAGKNSLYVFGHDAPPAGLPGAVGYQRLQHPDGVTALVNVPSYDLYAGKIYAVGEFADGSRYHFYDGVRVPNWYDGRARASFRVVGGDGTSSLVDLKIDGIAIIAGTVAWATSNADTAQAIADSVNSAITSPEYSAVSVDDTVTVLCDAEGAFANGRALAFTLASGFDVTPATGLTLSGGTDGLPEAAATGSLTITGGTSVPGVAATGSFRLTYGSTGSGVISAIKIDGVSIIGSAVPWNTDAATTAADVASAINSYTSVPDYTATSSGGTVTVTAAAVGTAPNGKAIVLTVTNVSSDSYVAMNGGVNTTDNSVAALTVGGVAIIGAPVLHTGNNATTATALAAAITAYASVPEYTATADGAKVTITSVPTGPAINGASVTPTVHGNVTVGSVQAMSGGTTAEVRFAPGSFVKTLGSKMHSVSGSNEHFSGIQQPTKWTTDATGAGFIDMSTEASGSEELTAVAKYQSYAAVFSESTVQIWYFDPNPDLNKIAQVLNNTGTGSPRSVTQFGDNDLFYLDESGLRSLRARDASNSAATTDIGVPIDTLVVSKLRAMTDVQRRKIIGVIEPSERRYWLAMLDTIFVFTFFGDTKVSAWTTYDATEIVGGVDAPFSIDDVVVYRRRVYIRSGDVIYVYGGLGATPTYDRTEAEARLPYLDGDAPLEQKTLSGVGAAVVGEWTVSVGMNPNAEDTEDLIGTINKTTYPEAAMPAEGQSTHFSLRFKSRHEGPAKLASAVMQY